jgi:sugar phosphate isomerase/epimerase
MIRMRVEDIGLETSLRPGEVVRHRQRRVKRREFLELAAAGPLGAMASRRREWPWLERIGVQLYTVRDLMQANVRATLELVARVGYREVEFAGYFDTPPDRLRRWLDDFGLTAPATHVPLLDGKLGGIFDAAQELGHRYLVQASIPFRQRRSLDAYRRVAASLNQAGAAARGHNLMVAYHNYDFELKPVGGIVPYDVLLAETDPALVCLEVDFYWMAKAGRDPLRYFAAHRNRFHLCHLKDIDRRGRITEVGSGRLDFQRILSQRAQAGLRHFFVEHDEPGDPTASIRTSYEYLRTLTAD